VRIEDAVVNIRSRLHPLVSLQKIRYLGSSFFSLPFAKKLLIAEYHYLLQK